MCSKAACEAFTIDFIQEHKGVNGNSLRTSVRFSMLKRAVALALVAGAASAWYVTRPTPPRQLPAATDEPTPARGVFHVHTQRSDGSGDVETIAQAAARAGLSFVIFSDHGDATRTPEPPRYVNGVLCIDSVEISTEAGHVVALGLPSSPYPLGGEVRDVLEDVARLRGFAVVAHPDSPKEDLRWRDRETPYDGVEWLNGDTEWRDETVWSLLNAAVHYPFYGSAALSALLNRPAATLDRWDALTSTRRVVAIAATDAHARLGLRGIGEPYDRGVSINVPSYEAVFRMFSNVLPSAMLTGDAAEDAQIVVKEISQGHLYSVIDGIASPGVLTFHATSGEVSASAGDGLPISGQVTVRAAVRGPDDTTLTLLKNGRVIDVRSGTSLERTVENEPAVYRVEASLRGSPGVSPIPWIVSNPIYVGRPERDDPRALQPPTPRATGEVAVQYRDGPATEWRTEHSPSSLAAIDEVPAINGQELVLRYALGGTASESAFAAFVMPAGEVLSAYDRVTFTARSDRPMRLSVQLRTTGASGLQRWHRSVYLEPTSREITVLFDDMRPSGTTSTPRPSLADIESVLFVLDTINTPLGGRGTLWLDDVRYVR
jgi:hypothetical protein